mmetsp:Transcript_21022/g.29677  ORF Transcript_21022/g.29677 Transcript_21022/m.29677 type:complete len:125 (-) Transcript_21022:341-715(-)
MDPHPQDQPTATFDTGLTKQLILHHQPKERIHADAVLTANELLRLFVVEARQRAAVEAECENEGVDNTANTNTTPLPTDLNNDDDDDEGRVLTPKPTATEGTQAVSIRADHITKIAAGLLMDFS